MLKRIALTVGLPVLATTALALVPTGAQAAPCVREGEPRICENGVLLTEAKKPIVSWGPIELKSATASLHCINTFYALGWNEGGVAKGEVTGWSVNSCSGTGALAGLTNPYLYATAEKPPTEGRKRGLSSLPWKLQALRGTREEREVVLQASGVGSEGPSARKTQCYPPVEGRTGAEVITAVPAGCVAVTIIVIAPESGAVIDEFCNWGSLEPTGVNGFGNGLNVSTLKFEGPISYHLESNEIGNGTTTGTVKLMGAELQGLMTSE